MVSKTVLGFLLLAFSARLHSHPILTEVQVENTRTLRDDDGDFSDWVEIQNPAAAPVNLAGYKLSNGLDKVWVFPAVTLEARGTMIVYASGKDRTDPARVLHSSFELKSGEMLDFQDPAGVSLSKVESLPEGPPDVSWGLSDDRPETSLVGPEHPSQWTHLTAPHGQSDPEWTARTPAQISSWSSGPNGLVAVKEQTGFELSAYRTSYVPTLADELNILFNRPQRLRLAGRWPVPAVNFGIGAEGELKFNGDAELPRPAAAGVGETLIYRARGRLSFSGGGEYTISVSAFTQGSPSVSAKVAGQSIFFSGGINAADEGVLFGTFTVPAAGEREVELWWVDQPAGVKGIELAMAPGRLLEFGGEFQLMGSLPRPVSHSTEPPADVPVGSRLASAAAAETSSILQRFVFDVPAGMPSGDLQLKMRYVEGFRAWIDGVPVAHRQAPPGQGVATAIRMPESALVPETISLPLTSGTLAGPAEAHVLTVETLPSSGGSLIYSHAELVARGAQTTAARHGFFPVPTPGQPNGTAVGPPAAEPDVSLPRGIYRQGVNVTLTSPDAGAMIFYSTDGSPPVQSEGSLYRGPVRLEKTSVLQSFSVLPGRLPSHTILHSYIITGAQAGQSRGSLPENWNGTPASYEFDKTRVEGAEETLASSLESLPCLSIHASADELFGNAGIFANPGIRGKLSAIDSSVEWLFPGNGDHWREKGTLRIKGESSRVEGFLKHGLRLDFGDGGGDLRRPVFRDSDRSRFNTLMLHGSAVDNIIGMGPKAQYIRDLWARDTLRKLGHAAAHGDYFHVYLNGLYWGLYHAGERSDAHWCARYMGGRDEDWDVINGEGIVSGSNEGWQALTELSKSPDATEANYSELQARLDLSGLCDYILVNAYAANFDWPARNWYAARDKRTNQWRFITWDAEASFDDPGTNMIDRILNGLTIPGSDAESAPGDLFKYAIRFPQFRRILTGRIHELTKPGGVLSPAVAEATWMNRAAMLHPIASSQPTGDRESAIFAEFARWSKKYEADIGGGPVMTEDWVVELNRLRSDWFPRRTRRLLNQLRTAELYTEVHAPAIFPPGGRTTGATVEVTIANTASNATLFYTTDGSDPRGDSEPSSTAIRYTGPFTVPVPSKVIAVGYYEGEASAAVSTEWTAGPPPPVVFISEVDYAPTQGNLEFVELFNPSAEPQSLAGVRLRNAVRFSFSATATIQPAQRLVLVRDAAAFAAAYPGVTIHGGYSGNLADEGETLELWSDTYGLLDSVRYRPHFPWAANRPAQNIRQSLLRSDLNGNDYRQWKLATPTPGQPPQTAPPGPLSLDLTHAAGSYWLEFPAIPESRYIIETSTTLGPDTWETIEEVSGASGMQRRPVSLNTERRFYRLRREPR